MSVKSWVADVQVLDAPERVGVPVGAKCTWHCEVRCMCVWGGGFIVLMSVFGGFIRACSKKEEIM